MARRKKSQRGDELMQVTSFQSIDVSFREPPRQSPHHATLKDANARYQKTRDRGLTGPA
jgi:hypothetical protein